MLTSRIRDLSKAIVRTGVGGAAEPADVESFLAANNVDETAAAMLRGLPPDQQQAVIARGNVDGRNPSAMLLGRVRDLNKGVVPMPARAATPAMAQRQGGFAATPAGLPTMFHGQPQVMGHPMQPLYGQPHMHGQPHMLGHPHMLGQPHTLGQPHIMGYPQPAVGVQPAGGYGMHGPGPAHSLDMAAFLARNPVDSAAAAELRALPPALAQLVTGRGNLEGTNLSAMLTKRIREVGRAAPAGMALPGIAMPMPGAPGGLQETEAFIRQNLLDESAASALRSLPAHLQAAVVGRGPLGGKNPSAMIMGRIRDAQRGSGGGGRRAGRSRSPHRSAAR